MSSTCLACPIGEDELGGGIDLSSFENNNAVAEEAFIDKETVGIELCLIDKEPVGIELCLIDI